jgi:hypothetical protein
MKNIVMLLSVFTISILTMFGQENRLHDEIRQLKESNFYFDTATFESASADLQVLRNFRNPNEVFFFNTISLDVRNKEMNALNLTLPLNSRNMVLELLEVPEFFYDYTILTSNGVRYSANRDIKHYRGVVRGEENSLVAITFCENEVMGLICTDEGNFNLVKDNQSSKHIFYNEKNQIEKQDFICGTQDDIFDSYDSEELFDTATTIDRSVIKKIVRFYIETDYSIYQTKGSIAAVESFIMGLLNQVATLYYNEDILTSVSKLYIWTVTDPYISASNTTKLLDLFEATRTSIHGDLGMLLTFREVGGGRAHVDGLCRASTKKKLGVAELDRYYDIVPIYSWSVEVVTHELGHLFGSHHTHACKWNGNNTAIDGCGITAGYPEGNCANPGHPIGGGTIMSYCDLPGLPGVNLNSGFGPQPGDVIRKKVKNAGCLDKCITSYTNKTITSDETIRGCDVLTLQNVTIRNNASVSIKAFGAVKLKSGCKATYGSKVNMSIDNYTPFPTLSMSSILQTNEETEANEDLLTSLQLAIESPEITDAEITVYPNPNDGNFVVKITGDRQHYVLEIFNNLGWLLGVINCNEEIVNINRTDLDAGIYYIRITMNEKISVKKVVVQ